MTSGEKIRKLRIEKHWSQATLADKLKVHVTHLNRIENGKYAPSLKLLKKASEILGASTEYLLRENSEDFEVKIKDKGLAEIIPLVDNLDEKEREAILTVVEAMLTKQRVLEMLTNVTQAAKEGKMDLITTGKRK